MTQHNTPLRYPGGKQRLTPFVVDLLRANRLLGGHYAEPFAGGAGVAINLLLSGHVRHIHLNDSCPAIYAFWRCLQRKGDEFCQRILTASLTVEEWRKQRRILMNPRSFSQLDIGFSFFYLNRCNRSGIPNGGVIGGLSQGGPWKMDARFPRNELVRRVEMIAARKHCMTISNLDAEVFIRKHVPMMPKKTLVYCDPPYFHESRRLYLNYYKAGDHAGLSQTVQKDLKRPWLVSYDSAVEIRKCYAKRQCIRARVQYNAARAYIGTELFFVSDNLKIPSQLSGMCLEHKALHE